MTERKLPTESEKSHDQETAQTRQAHFCTCRYCLKKTNKQNNELTQTNGDKTRAMYKRSINVQFTYTKIITNIIGHFCRTVSTLFKFSVCTNQNLTFPRKILNIESKSKQPIDSYTG